MRSLTACLAAAALVPIAALAADESTPFAPGTLETAGELRDRALEDNRAFELVESLTTEVGARFAGSEGDRAAVGWALTQLQDLGFRNVRAEAVEVPHWVRGDIEVAITSPFPQPLVAVALGGSVGTPDTGIEAPVIEVESLEALDAFEREDIDGKIVYFSKRMERHRTGRGYVETVPQRTEGPARAAKHGAVGVVIRSVGTSDNRIAHTGMTRYRDDVEKIPAAALSNPDADLLERQLATGRPVTLRMRLTSRHLPPATSANVVGEIPGRDPDAGIVVLGAHLDSWDVGPSAVDDGAGVAMVTEAARLIGELDRQPRRTIRVVLYANEEFGLSGAKAYPGAHEDELDRHSIAMEADFGAGRVWRFDSAVPEPVLPVVDAMHSVIEPLGIERGNNEAFGGADISTLKALGVPVLGPRQDGSAYFDYHHTRNDTLDKIDRDALDQNVAVYASLAWLAAEYPGDFGRLETQAEGEEETGDASSETDEENADTEADSEGK